MCKGITSRGSKCRAGMRPGSEYCHNHNPELHWANLIPSLNSIKYYFHWETDRVNGIHNNQIIRIKQQFLDTNTSEIIRRHLFDEVMPFLRDCWKYGYPGTDRFDSEVLRTHFPEIGRRNDLTDEALGVRQWTETQRRQARIRELNPGPGPGAGLPAQQIPQFNPALQRNPADVLGEAFEINRNVIHPAHAELARIVEIAHAARVPNDNPVRRINNIPVAFRDPQNVHRTSVNESVMKSIEVLCSLEWKRESWPILSKDGEKLPGSRVLLEKCFLWNPEFSLDEKEKTIWPMLSPLIEKNSISELMNYNENVYGKKPWVVLYKVFNWIFQQSVETQKDSLMRLLQELYEGREMCIQGKVSRIVNSLVGIHPEIHVGLSGKEMLQERMAQLARREDIEAEARMEEGRDILRDAKVPETEWGVWLEPLLLF